MFNISILVVPYLICVLDIGHWHITDTVQLSYPIISLLGPCRCLEPLPLEQGNMEYTKQLILSCLLNICQKLSPDGGKIPKGMCVLCWREGVGELSTSAGTAPTT